MTTLYWYEVRFTPDDIGWEFDTLSQAITFAENRGEKTGQSYLVYKCSYEGGDSFLVEV